MQEETQMARLAGKVALITGAAGGQGTAEAELFVREGAAVVLTDIDATAGEALARRLQGAGGRVLFLQQDAADESAWRDVVAAAQKEFGKLHILVNNAGTRRASSTAPRSRSMAATSPPALAICATTSATNTPPGSIEPLQQAWHILTYMPCRMERGDAANSENFHEQP
jgi:NAD(P)-dependent dehydrogenase (short-subunit alcohol dehydrogenase family)